MKLFTPMSPLLTNEIPLGNEWGYQLKWDGYRMIARVDEGRVELYSKKMLLKNNKFPDLVHALTQLEGSFLLDGEAVILDSATGRPSFQKMQQRDKLAHPKQILRAAENEPILYIVFDLLELNQEDWRGRPFQERNEKLREIVKPWGTPFFITDVFTNGPVLWDWVVANGWEGVVSKRLSSPYRVGKEHHDWFKKKTNLQLEVEFIGILMKEGRVSSLVMRKDKSYLGRVSSGLNGKLKEALLAKEANCRMEDYFGRLPEGLKYKQIRWFNQPLIGTVSGLEMTEGGQLRHPKLLLIGGLG